MPYITILTPKSGDTRRPPVFVQSSRSFTGSAKIDSCVGSANCDTAGPTYGPGGGVHLSAGINAPGSAAGIVYTVTATSNPAGQGAASEPNVTVKTGTVPIGTVTTESVKTGFFADLIDTVLAILYGLLGYKKFTIGGTVDPALNPAAVVLVAFRLNGATFVAEATKLILPSGGTWSGELWLPCAAGRIYVVRALVFDDQANQTGSTTEVLIC